MKLDLTSKFTKFYLGMGTCVCILYIVGALAGWKIPASTFAASSGRGYGGSWGYGK